MGVPRIHLEQIFGPFGEKPDGPFSVLIPWARWNLCGVWVMDDEKSADVFHHPRAKADNRDAVKIVYNNVENE